MAHSPERAACHSSIPWVITTTLPTTIGGCNCPISYNLMYQSKILFSTNKLKPMHVFKPI